MALVLPLGDPLGVYADHGGEIHVANSTLTDEASAFNPSRLVTY